MAGRKFYALIMFWLMLLAVVCSGGCGGSGGGVQQAFSPTPIVSPDPTPTPTPTPGPTDTYYTVTFDSDGGSSVPSQRVIAGGTVTKPNDPVKEGYVLSGWYKDEGRTVMFTFGENGDRVTQDITLYAGWTPAVPPALVEAEYALAHIAIGYQGGDNPNYVTHNLILPVRVDAVDDVTITWTSSNPGTVSDTGNVNRQASDTKVTLTARVTKDNETAEKNFDVNVIRQRSRTVEQAKAEIQVKGVTEIRAMNASNDEFHITYSASRDRVTDIDGKYADFAIRTADDALDAVQSLHGILGINDPYEELEPNVVTSDAYGAEYTFAQVYNGMRVSGRNITVSTNRAGEGNFITSNTVPSSRLENGDLNFTYSKEQAENSAKSYHSGSFDVIGTEKIIFSLFNCENDPVPAYSMNVCGTDSEGNYIDENVIVNARNGKVIFTSSNIHTLNVAERTAKDELFDMTHNYVSFPVFQKNLLDMTYEELLYDPDTKVKILIRDANLSGIFHDVKLGEHDPQQISAYTNMIKVIKWWKASFDRDSLDGNGMTVKVVTHFPGGNDNAGWSMYNQSLWGLGHFDVPEPLMLVFDPLKHKRSPAAAVEAMAHESGHAVLGYEIGCRKKDDFPYTCSFDKATGKGTATGAIDEGYADIFACLMSGQWKLGWNIEADGEYMRNIADPAEKNMPKHLSEVYYPIDDIMQNGFTTNNDHGGVHTNSSLVSYPFYLMNTTYGISMNDLAEIWYESMRMGYNATSNFRTVRTSVIRAARTIGKSPEIISGIKKAFDDVGIKEESATLRGTVSQYNGNALSGVSVSETPTSTSSPATSNSYSTSGNTSVTDASGKFSFELAAGLHRLDISHAGYVPFKAITYVEEALDNVLDIPLVTPSGNTRSTMSGTVRDALTGEPVGGGTLKIYEGWNFHTGDTVSETTVTTDGTYTVSLPAGYYTADFSKTGYITTSINHLVIPPNESLRQNVIMSQTTDNNYRVTLQWDENPHDLDSHLIGPLPYGGSFHVYFSDMTATDNQGVIVAQLDHDDVSGWGFETITFRMQPGDKFKYFVHWYAGEGTWSGSNAVVNLYKSTDLIGTFTVPNVNMHGDEAGRYWHVFDLTDGLDPVQPPSSSLIVNDEPTLDSQNASSTAIRYYPQKFQQTR